VKPGNDERGSKAKAAEAQMKASKQKAKEEAEMTTKAWPLPPSPSCARTYPSSPSGSFMLGAR
jgi:hypothetical protein